MLDWRSMDRLLQLARRGHHGTITAAEKGELRQLMAQAVPAVQDLAWADLMDVAYFWVGVYGFAEMAAEARAASAS